MNKREFIDRLIRAADYARKLAISLDYVDVDLPKDYLFSLYLSNDPFGEKDPEETIKFLGGRLVKRKELKSLSPVRAGELMWVDGLVSEWINICAIGYSQKYTAFEIMFTPKLIEANQNILPPDLGMPPGNELSPFRVRGPSIADWEEAKNNA